jgi:glycerol kinase
VPELVGALDQGTTSTRFMVFDHAGRVLASHQLEHAQIYPRPGWVEHDPVELLANAREVMSAALARAGLRPADLAAVGVANQRETVVAWDRETGEPYLHALVWQDTRSAPLISELVESGATGWVRDRTGLVPATYFSAGKVKWALDNVPGLLAAARTGRACFGTVDSWLVWHLTGGPRGGLHVTDVTNASRTMLMDLRRCRWDAGLLELFGVPVKALPEIRPSLGQFGEAAVGGEGEAPVAVTAVLGDQQAAMFGQVCFAPGDAKSTYGTGNFLLVNTGSEVAVSRHGLLSTACYQLGGAVAPEGADPVYALEGSVAVTGAAVQWLRDQLGVISTAAEVEGLAASVPDNGGVYFVPAFGGLFGGAGKGHLARATLEAICFQTRDVVEAMEGDLGRRFSELRVDGGVTANSLCMQLQADILGIPVSRPAVAETTALGAAYAAGCAAGVWAGLDELADNWREPRRWEPRWTRDRRDAAYADWQRAVERALGWAGTPPPSPPSPSSPPPQPVP